MNIDWNLWSYYLYALLLVVGSVVAWLLNLVALPGNWLIVGGAALFAWLLPVENDRGIAWNTVIALAVLATIGEAIEFAAGAAGAAKQGASRRAIALSMVGAIAGSIIGLSIGVPIPVVGSLVMALFGGAAGAFAGAYLGEAWKGREEPARSAAGRGAFLGRIWGTVGKFAVGAVMLAIVAWDAFL
ncbi:MAG: DUF456 domain-containing protein [Planctomycetes bacterium]|nr:DUF456 domain-containing protein [Planctomycetota bacterium]